MRRLDRVEPGLQPRHVLAGERVGGRVDLRVGALAHDLGDQEGRAD